MNLLVLASQFDGRNWVRLSGDAELVEIPGGHFDWVTGRINDLARYLRSWPIGGPTSSRGSRPSLIRLNGEALASEGDREAPASGAPKTKPFSRPLRWILNYARQ